MLNLCEHAVSLAAAGKYNWVNIAVIAIKIVAVIAIAIHWCSRLLALMQHWCSWCGTRRWVTVVRIETTASSVRSAWPRMCRRSFFPACTSVCAVLAAVASVLAPYVVPRSSSAFPSTYEVIPVGPRRRALAPAGRSQATVEGVFAACSIYREVDTSPL